MLSPEDYHAKPSPEELPEPADCFEVFVDKKNDNTLAQTCIIQTE